MYRIIIINIFAFSEVSAITEIISSNDGHFSGNFNAGIFPLSEEYSFRFFFSLHFFSSQYPSMEESFVQFGPWYRAWQKQTELFFNYRAAQQLCTNSYVTNSYAPQTTAVWRMWHTTTHR